MAGMIVMADVIKLCELDASITTGGIDQTGGSNACVDVLDVLGFTITLFHIGLSFLDSMHLPSIQFHSICQVSSMCQLLYWVLGLHK